MINLFLELVYYLWTAIKFFFEKIFLPIVFITLMAAVLASAYRDGMLPVIFITLLLTPLIILIIFYLNLIYDKFDTWYIAYSLERKTKKIAMRNSTQRPLTTNVDDSEENYIRKGV